VVVGEMGCVLERMITEGLIEKATVDSVRRLFLFF
jgi:hypothetical protein